MKLIRNILIWVFVMLLLWMQNITYSNNDNYKIIVWNQLLMVDKWEVYKNIIDTFIDKNIDNKKILEKLQSRITTVKQKLDSWKYSLNKYKEQVKAIIAYFDITVNLALQDIYNEEIKEEEELEEEVIEEEIEEEVEDIIYPGFSSVYNDKTKTILAWKQNYVYAWGVLAFYEEADVSKVVFFIEWTNMSDFNQAIAEAYLFVEWSLLETAAYADIKILSSTRASISFDNINNFIIPKTNTIDFRLALKPSSIWYEKIWKTMKDLRVLSVKFDEVSWVTTGDSFVKMKVDSFSSERFSIVSGLLNVTKIEWLDTANIIELSMQWDFWDNSDDSWYSAPYIGLDKLKVSVWGNNSENALYTMYNKNDSSDAVTWVYGSWTVLFDLSTLQVWNKSIAKGANPKYWIKITWTNISAWMEILRDWITYDIIWNQNSNNINLNLKNSINLWQRNF